MDYEITFEDNPTPEEVRILSDGIDEHTRAKVGERGNRPLTFFLRGAGGRIVGGAHGKYASSGWLYVNVLWVAERVRGGGHGARLMSRIEQEAVRRGCSNAYLDTFSFQAPESHRKLGYTVFGELPDSPPATADFF